MRCECGRLKVDGKCPLCDSPALARPRRRARQLEAKVRRREREAEHIGLSPGAAYQAFKRFAEKRKLVIPKSIFQRQKERA